MPYLGNSPQNNIRQRYYYTATGGQTVFTGADDNGTVLKYQDNKYLDVYLNGVLLQDTIDYTALTKSSVTLLSGATAGDLVEIVAYGVFSVADTVSASLGGTFSGNVGIGTDATAGYALSVGGKSYIDNNTNITPDTSWSGQLTIRGNGYSGGLALDGTGMWVGHNSGVRSLILATNETERMRIDASGAVGIGIASAGARLHVNTTTANNTDGIVVTGGGGSTRAVNIIPSSGPGGYNPLVRQGDSTIIFTNGVNDAASTLVIAPWSTGDNGLRIDHKGNLSVGTISTPEKISANGGIALLGELSGGKWSANGCYIGLETGYACIELVGESGSLIDFSKRDEDFRGRIIHYNTSNNFSIVSGGTGGSLSFTVVGAEAMRITSGAAVVVANTVAYGDGTIGLPRLQWTAKSGNHVGALGYADTTGAQASIVFRNPNGTVGQISLSGTTTTYTTTSDYRLKENVVPIEDGLTRLIELKPSRFNFKSNTMVMLDGFLAHEVESIVPEAVIGTKDAVNANNEPIYQSMDASKLIPLLVAAVKELKVELDDYKARLSALENV